MSALETRTFRAENLEEALGAVRSQLGPEAIVVRQREGIVGGIGGFFGKKCVEIDVECEPESLQGKPSAMPARALTTAYAAAASLAPEDDDDQGDLFRTLLDDSSSLFASTLAEAIDHPEQHFETAREDEPEPVPFEFEAIAVQPVAAEPIEAAQPIEPGPSINLVPVHEPVAPIEPPPASSTGLVPAVARVMTPLIALTQAGIELRLAESIVADADAQLRVFDPAEPFENHVRQILASRIATRALNGRFRRRVIAVVGAHESGKTTAAAHMCAAFAAAGRRVVALSLEPVRETLELGRLTEQLAIELISADHPGLVDFAVQKVKRAEVVIIDTPGVASRDDDGWARLGMLLKPLEVNETHLVLPGSLYPAGVDAFIGIASEKLRVDRLLLTQLDSTPGPGPAISAAVRAGIPISATSSGERLVPADSHNLARLILP